MKRKKANESEEGGKKRKMQTTEERNVRIREEDKDKLKKGGNGKDLIPINK